MAKYFAFAVDRPDLKSYEISQTLRGQLHYFTEGVSSQRWDNRENPNEFFFPLERTSELYEEGVFYVTSPLDDQNKAEVEITEEQEDFLAWLVSNKIEKVRMSEG
ncbi:MAG: hypothetical protein O7E52_22550 [Candidatus Poribacteria bacterium]|nr:hypothetical protein [Candidatus Poribacteria bacterium]